jgi:hypothetical protein
MYPVLKITHMLNFLDTYSMGVTETARVYNGTHFMSMKTQNVGHGMENFI